jgi:hypothetical protein
LPFGLEPVVWSRREDPADDAARTIGGKAADYDPVMSR